MLSQCQNQKFLAWPYLVVAPQMRCHICCVAGIFELSVAYSTNNWMVIILFEAKMHPNFRLVLRRGRRNLGSIFKPSILLSFDGSLTPRGRRPPKHYKNWPGTRMMLFSLVADWNVTSGKSVIFLPLEQVSWESIQPLTIRFAYRWQLRYDSPMHRWIVTPLVLHQATDSNISHQGHWWDGFMYGMRWFYVWVLPSLENHLLVPWHDLHKWQKVMCCKWQFALRYSAIITGPFSFRYVLCKWQCAAQCSSITHHLQR